MRPVPLLGVGVIGLVAIFGTLVLGPISDRLPRRNILAAIYGIRGLGFFALLLIGILYGWAYLGHQSGAMISSWLGGWAMKPAAPTGLPSAAPASFC